MTRSPGRDAGASPRRPPAARQGWRPGGGSRKDAAGSISFMDGGHIAADGTPEQIIDNPGAVSPRLQQFLNFVGK